MTKTISVAESLRTPVWKYLFDEVFYALIRSDGRIYEYYDAFANGWYHDPFGPGTFLGYSGDSERFREVPGEKIQDIIVTISRLRRC
ncbi:MAG TPA: hypothetical protein VMT44_07540 [Methanoregula sp.]|nr:hypothetical protein [Methanoregula sp.]